MAQSFTSLKLDIPEDVDKVCSFSRSVNETFPWKLQIVFQFPNQKSKPTTFENTFAPQWRSRYVCISAMMIWASLYNTLNAHPRMLLMSLKWDDRSSFSWNLLIANFWAEKRDDRLVFTRFPKRFSLLTNMVVRCFSVAALLVLLLLMPIACESLTRKKIAVYFHRGLLDGIYF